MKIPALKYGKGMEIEAVNVYPEYIKNYHQDCIIQKVGWFWTKPCHKLGQIQTS